MILLTFAPLTLAEEATDQVPEPVLISANPTLGTETELSDSDKAEISQMNTPLGTQVRLLQLEKRLTRNYLIGEQIIEIIQKNHEDENITELEDLSNKMYSLKEEVISLTNQTLTSEEAAAEYVSIKKEAITTTKEFRDLAQAILTLEDKREIAEAIKNIDANQLNSLNGQIVGLIRNYNAQKITAFMAKIGKQNQELAAQIRNGELMQSQIRERLLEHYSDVNKSVKEQIMSQVKQNIAKRNAEQKAIIDHAKQQVQQKIEALKERIVSIRTNKKGSGNQ